MTVQVGQYAAPLSAVDGWTVSTSGDVLTVHARKKVVTTDPYLAGHFPGNVIFPGAFVVECLRQAITSALAAPVGEVTALCSLRFLRPLYPGDELSLEATVRLLASRESGGRRYGVRAVGTCGGEPVALLAVELDI